MNEDQTVLSPQRAIRKTGVSAAGLIEQLRKIPLFSTLDNDDLQNLVSGSSEVRYPKHSCLTYEGEPGDRMFVLQSGEVSVTAVAEDGQLLNLAVLKPGQHFGEQAILPDSPGVRTATIRCLSDVVVVEISRHVFLVTLNRNLAILDGLKEMGARHLRHRMAQETALFRTITLEPDAKDWLTEKNFKAGEIVFRQGDKPDYFYLILSGVAVIFKETHGDERFLTYIGSGGFFGELALINDEPRSATVRAKHDLSTLVLRGESFKSLYLKSKDLQRHFDNLSTIYQLPNRGLITMHASKLMGRNATMAMFHNKEGPQLAFSRVVGESMFSISKTAQGNDPKVKQYRFEDDANGIQRELIVSDGHVLNVTGIGSWLDVSYLLNTVYTGQRLKKRQLALFRLQGDLRLEREEFGTKNDTVICQCAGVSRGTLKKCINSGFNSVSDVCDETSAGKVCGSCIPLITDMLGRTDMMLAAFVDSTPVSDNITSFRFHPKHGKFQRATPTQHVVVKAQIGSQWVRRSYTLTSSAHSTKSYEIMVKKEDGGLFSSWLHDTMTHEDLIRIGKPKGGYDLSHKVSVPYVFFMAGVGVTPAIGYLRSVEKMNEHELERQVLIDISTAKTGDLICSSELDALADARKNLSINYRFTQKTGHLQPGDIDNIVASYTNATYFICGPAAYQDMVESTLKRSGIAEKAIQIESFLEHHTELSQAEKREKARSQSKHQGHRIAYLFSLVAILLVAWVSAFPTVDLLATVQANTLSHFLLTDKVMQQVTGFAILGLIALGMLFSLRKRVNFITFVRFTWWRLAHLCTGLLALAGLYFHAGLSLGNNQNFYLTALLLLLAVIGASTMIYKIKSDRSFSAVLAGTHERLRRWHLGLALFFPSLLIGHIISGYYF